MGRLKAIFWLVSILLGGLQAWDHRYSTSSSDTISYLDIGDAYFRGEWHLAINGNWSPLYSWLLGLTISILKPSPYWEFAAVKLTNFLIYLFALACFEFFLQELIFYYKEKILHNSNRYFEIPQWVWLVSGYTLFLWSALNWIGVYCDTPDMCTAALIYLATGIVMRIGTGPDNWVSFIILGAALGFSYLSKAVMFPLAFVFLGIGMLSVGDRRRALPQVLIALLVFAVIAGPFVVALSTTKGRLTYSDTGKLSYVWYINPSFVVIPFTHWQGGPDGYGTPKHPTRKVFDNPLVFEFGTPVVGTYPPWHDPSYWYEGVKLKFSFINQTKVLAKNILFYYEYFLGSLVFGYLIIACAGGRLWLSVKDLTKSWKLLILGGAGLGVYIIVSDFYLNYAHVQPSTRLIAPFIVLLFAGCFSSVRLPNSLDSKRLITGLTISTLLMTSGQLIYHSSKDFASMLRLEPTQWQVAQGLKKLEIQPGDSVARFGQNFGYRWARLARVKIIAEINDASSFWTKDAAVRSDALKAIAKTGAKAIVQEPGLLIPDISTSGWEEMGNTGYYAYPLYK